MTDHISNTPTPTPGRPAEGVSRAQQAAEAASEARVSGSGAEFQALLERLEIRVQGLEATKDKVEGPAD
ncbi:MAG: hypothetical protein QF724_00730, partial [Planctomycetota bacterium]|nr:hypothetical protein [Planctomycetota bacterium]